MEKNSNNTKKNWLIISVLSVLCSLFSVLCLFLPSLSFAQSQPISPPSTLEKAKEIGEKLIHGTIGALPKILEKIWKEEVLPVWRGMYNWAKKTFWDPYIWPIFKKFENIFKKEVEKRKEIIKEEFPKEKKELKKEIKEKIVPKTIPNLWQKFKELIK